MRFFTFVGVVFYTLVLCLIGGLILSFSMHLIQIQDVEHILQAIYNFNDLRITTGIIGALLIILSFSFARLILGRMQKERTIAFENPSGMVTVSLSAVEDLVRRLTTQIPEIRDSRPEVIATKKGIEMDLRIVLRSEVNIPELTLKLQELIKTRIQEILGVEESVAVRIHVAKIVGEEEDRGKRRKGNAIEEKEEPTVPFQGYAKL
ncbi:MAG: alkaline shock response membrane anchor protein AmaP [Candidatus Omnitrophota bacterium]|nr:alkaline shock response membrane anchor protein AmaP [Candidatus Omnitrophota bacterium]